MSDTGQMQDTVGDIVVTTAQHERGHWSTWVRGGQLDGWAMDYETEQQAIDGHAYAIKTVAANADPIDPVTGLPKE